ncbi:MAG TPA: glycosyl hydrolase [Verrucomicrobiae bacterium]|nr:glycosyl hydrolase [Verrucomicrobiae bacterium]
MGKFISFLILTVLACACGAAETPANPSANAQAHAVLKYFQNLESRSDKHLLSGQFSNFGSEANLRLMKKIHDQTGHWPAILGVDYADFGRISFTHDAPNKAAIAYWRQGGLVTVSAHLYNPARTDDYGLRDTNVDLNSLLDTNSPTHARWMDELDEIANGLQELQTNGVVVLWRPFHEMNGDWFWWDGKDPETFKKLWRQTFDYLTTTKKLNNLLWVYAPNHGTNTVVYYPGDKYVDLVGLDAYTDFVDTNHVHGYAEIARIKKPFGFTEFGPHGSADPPGSYDYTRFLAGVKKNFPRAVFFMSWNAKWSLAANTNVAQFLNDGWVVNREDLPKRPANDP